MGANAAGAGAPRQQPPMPPGFSAASPQQHHQRQQQQQQAQQQAQQRQQQAQQQQQARTTTPPPKPQLTTPEEKLQFVCQSVSELDAKAKNPETTAHTRLCIGEESMRLLYKLDEVVDVGPELKAERKKLVLQIQELQQWLDKMKSA